MKGRGTASQGLLMAWAGLLVLQVARGTGGASGFQWPEPRLIVAPAVIYTGLSLLALASGPLAVAFAVGIDVAVAINPEVMASTEKTLTRVVGVSGKAPAADSGAALNPLTSPAPANPLVVGSGGGRGIVMN